MRFSQLLKQVLLVCVSLFALTGQAMADLVADANRAYDAGNYVKAEKLWRLAAEQGNVQAQWTLGRLYDARDIPFGVAKNSKEAEKWYRKAAEQGNESAQLNLGLMYLA